MNIYDNTIPYDETEQAADYLVKYCEYKCTKLEALRYISAEHEYLNKVGIDIYSDDYQKSESFDYNRMLEYISEKANLSKKKTNALRLVEFYYLDRKSLNIL